MVTLRDRFDAKVQRVPGIDCWLWMGSMMSAGYGNMKGTEKYEQAHRVSWQLNYGPIPKGMHVLHRCDVPLCVRPDHLFLGTDYDNVHDAIAKGRFRPGGYNPGLFNFSKTYCKMGHAFDEQNTRIAKTGSRVCKACARDAMIRYHARQKGDSLGRLSEF